MGGASRHRRRRSLGQHWLADRRTLARIDAAADFTPEDTVVEIGPGQGALTELLARRASRLIGVEVDEDLIDTLRERFADLPSVRILSADVMTITTEEILEAGGGSEPFVMTGNLPYNIGTAVVTRFLRGEPKPRWMLVTLQAEVAESMCSRAGAMTYLGALTQIFATPRLLFYIPPRAFRPPPKVRSAVVRLDVRESPLVPEGDTEAMIRMLQAGFAAPRKRIRNSLAIGLRIEAAEAERRLEEAGVDPALRPAGLGMDEWLAVCRAVAAAGGGE